jgi:uncharacterized protein YfaS (alpha-2-macroglobulin family)
VDLTVPNDAYQVVVEDFIPAGTEILDTTLQTASLGDAPAFDPLDPFAQGWGWWNFSRPQIYDDHIVWAAGYLPAGAYQLTYTLLVLQPGQYHVLPARAWQMYFPEVQGSSAGAVFEILKEE